MSSHILTKSAAEIFSIPCFEFTVHISYCLSYCLHIRWRAAAQVESKPRSFRVCPTDCTSATSRVRRGWQGLSGNPRVESTIVHSMMVTLASHADQAVHTGRQGFHIQISQYYLMSPRLVLLVNGHRTISRQWQQTDHMWLQPVPVESHSFEYSTVVQRIFTLACSQTWRHRGRPPKFCEKLWANEWGVCRKFWTVSSGLRNQLAMTSMKTWQSDLWQFKSLIGPRKTVILLRHCALPRLVVPIGRRVWRTLASFLGSFVLRTRTGHLFALK